MANVSISTAARLLKKTCLINILSSGEEENKITLSLESTGGVGKTSIVKQIAQEMGGEAFCIDCTTISDGELNGFPFQSTNEDGEKFVDYSPFYVFAAIRKLEKLAYMKAKTEGFLGGRIRLDENDNVVLTTFKNVRGEDGKQETKEIKTVIPSTLNKALYTQNNYSWGLELPEEIKFELINSGELKPVIVLFDEVNRASKAVLAETMNILLYHRVQSYILPWWANIVIAINPGGANAEDYVQKINGAQKSRLLKIQIVPDINDWARYTLQHGGDEALVEVLMGMPTDTFDNHVQPEVDPMQTDGRGWSFVSTILKYIDRINAFACISEEERTQTENDCNFLCEGKVGTAAIAVINARKNTTSLPKPAELFDGTDKINLAAIEKIRAVTSIKRYIFVEAVLNYLAKEIRNMTTSKKSAAYLKQFAAVYDVLDETNRTYFLKCLKIRHVDELGGKNKQTILDVINAPAGTAKEDWQSYLYTTALATFRRLNTI